jgi:hypothetical protein
VEFPRIDDLLVVLVVIFIADSHFIEIYVFHHPNLLEIEYEALAAALSNELLKVVGVFLSLSELNYIF